ncbi:3-oxoadipate enol-lactonase [Grosmannia clavigera kw1407]|uniref:3-oxoadipate enol-lactonase n=1 Tax=Grosmannia clavigera (strain kw1407 / UAMH 11150) TaxID=655863 RepID=F0X757_GROCL|nr:3-oxoadipate enol-lactonase [Grosmannia clavigera kw1407]EFX06696.1 3-oxoadipate enol-lactonase [Grosmannia clavigera kw1407]
MAATLTASSGFVLPDGRTICYRLSFADDVKRPTILLAGMLATTGAVWARVVDELHRAGFRTLAYDHPGHGGSAPPAVLSTNTFEAMSDDVLALVKGLLGGRGIEPPQKELLHAWIGCSLGAATGVVFAARHPGILRHLVVCDTGSQSPFAAGGPDAVDSFTPRVQAARAAGSLAETLAGTRTRWFGQAWLQNPAHADEAGRLQALMAETTLDGYETCIAALLAPGFDLERHEAPRLADCLPPGGRVLVLVGEKDEPLPPAMKTLASLIRAGFAAKYGAAAAEKSVRFAVVPGAGHASFVDGFDAWCALVLPFLQS